MRLALAGAAILAGASLAVATAAENGKALLYGGAGQGRVVFDGRTHAAGGLRCHDCHPALFATHKQALITMSDHAGPKACFACHDGTTSTTARAATEKF